MDNLFVQLHFSFHVLAEVRLRENLLKAEGGPIGEIEIHHCLAGYINLHLCEGKLLVDFEVDFPRFHERLILAHINVVVRTLHLEHCIHIHMGPFFDHPDELEVERGCIILSCLHDHISFC